MKEKSKQGKTESTGRIYWQCLDCRSEILRGCERRKANKEKQHERISENKLDADKMNEGK